MFIALVISCLTVIYALLDNFFNFLRYTFTKEVVIIKKPEMVKYNLPWSNYTLIGKSTGRLETGFVIEQLDIYLDAGVNYRRTSRNSMYLITHVHFDHYGMLPAMVTYTRNNIQGKVNSFVLAPNESVNTIHEYETYSRSNKPCGCYEPHTNYTVIRSDTSQWLGMTPGMKLEMPYISSILIKAVKCDHSIDTLGYILYEKRKKMKPEYIGVDYNILNKDDMTYDVEVPMLAYLCDTTLEVFTINPDILESNIPVIMIECTFLDDEQEAAKRKHVCWSQLRDITSKYLNTTFILFHFSARYKQDDIVRLTADRTCNVKLWLEDGVV